MSANSSVVFGDLRSARGAGEFLHVPQIGHRLRTALRELVGVVRVDRAEHDRGDGALHRCALDELVLAAELGVVDLLEPAFVATLQRMAGLHVDHVPRHLLGLHHALDLRRRAVPFVLQHLGAGGLREGLHVRFFLALRVRAAPRGDGQCFLRMRGGSECQQRGSAQGRRERHRAVHLGSPDGPVRPVVVDEWRSSGWSDARARRAQCSGSARQWSGLHPTLMRMPTCRLGSAWSWASFSVKSLCPQVSTASRVWSP